MKGFRHVEFSQTGPAGIIIFQNQVLLKPIRVLLDNNPDASNKLEIWLTNYND
jgi:hypothetical protein